MSWVKDGSTIKIDYLGFVVEGVITHSRVKYGGTVQYTVLLDAPLTMPWDMDNPRTMVVADEEDILTIDGESFTMGVFS
jgi:hypothetical protein